MEIFGRVSQNTADDDQWPKNLLIEFPALALNMIEQQHLRRVPSKFVD
jgi:hypothetical protein